MKLARENIEYLYQSLQYVLIDQSLLLYQPSFFRECDQRNLLESYQGLHREPIWRKIQTHNLWPKVSHFLGLVGRRKLLTWNHIQKRGLHGPSFCYLYKEQEETMEHLLNNYPFIENIWILVLQLFGHSNDTPNNLIEMIKNWRVNLFNNVSVKKTWALVSGSFLWPVLKERNWRIFHNKQASIDFVQKIVKQNIMETILLKSWGTMDWKVSQQEATILNSLEIVRHPQDYPNPHLLLGHPLNISLPLPTDLLN